MTGKRQGVIGLLVMLSILAAILWNSASLSWHEFVWIAQFYCMSFIRMTFGMRTRENKITISEKHLSEKLLLFGMFLSMALLPVIYLSTKQSSVDVFGFANYSLPTFMSWFGAALVLPFLYSFWRSHADLGRNWSVTLEIHSEQELVTHGVYKHIRHPMYAALWLAVIAQPLLIHNWIAGLLVVFVFLAMYLSRMQQEEAMMLREFGAEYHDYAQQTGRIFPRLFSIRQPK